MGPTGEPKLKAVLLATHAIRRWLGFNQLSQRRILPGGIGVLGTCFPSVVNHRYLSAPASLHLADLIGVSLFRINEKQSGWMPTVRRGLWCALGSLLTIPFIYMNAAAKIIRFSHVTRLTVSVAFG